MALVDGGWLLGLFGFNAFAMISVYVMFFDGPKLLAAHALWILLATAVFAMHVGASANVGAVSFTASTLAAVAPVVATEVAVVVIDLDRFKDVNDKYGHTVGDEVLIRRTSRPCHHC